MMVGKETLHVVDYMIASSSLFPKFRNFGVGDFDMSDHLPLYCSLKLDYRKSTFGNVLHQPHESNTFKWIKYKWNTELKDTFLKKQI